MLRLFILFLFASLVSFAEDDDLQEAPTLKAQPVQKSESVKTSDQIRYRAYAFIEGRWTYANATTLSAFGGPYVEADATLDFKASESWKFFADGVANYSQYTNSATATLNQIGIRFLPTADLVFAIGRERNRRSPGLFVSPSDFLHTNPALAGPREVRTGEWIARVSHQSTHYSTDIIYVPYRTLTTGGIPNENIRGEGLVRHFHKLGPLDLDLSAGYLDSKFKAGASLLGFVADVWKVYGEIGYNDSPFWNSLLGLSYEGSDKFSVRAEFLYSSASSITPVPLPSGWSAILSIGFPDVKDRFNFFITGMKSLSADILVALVRAEWLMNNRMTLGTSFLRGPTQDLQWSLDWRFSF